MSETPLSEVKKLPMPVLEHYVELYLILSCNYDDKELRQKEIDAEVAALDMLGWKTIIEDGYFDIVRKDLYN
jgi:hypothetical protein